MARVSRDHREAGETSKVSQLGEQPECGKSRDEFESLRKDGA